MKSNTWLIRHAQSQSNVGMETTGNAKIELTEFGKVQAIALLTELTDRPDLIIISKYPRTEQTAAPLIEKFPNVPVEIWPVEEFHFLDEDICFGTTMAQRRPIVKEYLERNDPNFRHGPGAESFNDMCNRGRQTIEKLCKMPADKNVFIFTHGQFIATLLLMLNDAENLNISNVFANAKNIENAQIIRLENISKLSR